MSEVKHTPGPWEVAELEPQSIDIVSHGLHLARIDLEAHYAECGEPGDRPDDESKANAKLIASAPALLAALEANHRMILLLWEVENNLLRRQALADRMDANTSLIAKAKGAK